jgi:hypothetical protein
MISAADEEQGGYDEEALDHLGGLREGGRPPSCFVYLISPTL